MLGKSASYTVRVPEGSQTQSPVRSWAGSTNDHRELAGHSSKLETGQQLIRAATRVRLHDVQEKSGHLNFAGSVPICKC